MNIQIVISGARTTREKDVIKEELIKYGLPRTSIYDCEDYPTDIVNGGKQGSINDLIRNCDWYILVASTTCYGDFTVEEWHTAIDRLAGMDHDRECTVTVFKCSNPEESQRAQNIDSFGTPWEEMEAYQKEKLGLNFYVDYRYDTGFEDLHRTVAEEIRKVYDNNLVLRKHSIPARSVKASDIYINKHRTLPENGFDENTYFIRREIDDVLDSQWGMVVVSGAPCSGKTRAIYECIKRRAIENPELRIVPLTRDNLGDIATSLKKYDEWRETVSSSDRSGTFLQHYIFVADQANNLQGSRDERGWFKEIYREAVVRHGATLLASTLSQGADWFKDEAGFEFTTVRIPLITDTNDSLFLENIRTHWNNEEPHSVIGQYIDNLSKYYRSIEKEIEAYEDESAHKKYLSRLARAWIVLKTFRHLNEIPVGPLMNLMEKDPDFDGSGKIDYELFGDFLKYLEKNNVLRYRRLNLERIAKLLQKKASRIEYKEQQFELDGERITMPVDPNFVFEISDDYIWDVILNKYGLNKENFDDMRSATAWYLDTFYEENPISTLRRILLRSPITRLNRWFSVNDDSVFSTVYDCLKETVAEGRLDSDLIKLAGELLGRAPSNESFEEVFNFIKNYIPAEEIDKDHLGAEILYYGLGKDRSVRKRMSALLDELEINPSPAIPHSYIFASRYIHYLDNFDEMADYIRQATGNLFTTGPDSNADCNYLVVQLVKNCSEMRHYTDLAGLIEKLGLRLDKSTIINISCAFKDLCKNNKILDVKESVLSGWYDLIISNNGKYCNENLPVHLAYFYLISMCRGFNESYPYFLEAIKVSPPQFTPFLVDAVVKGVRMDESLKVLKYFFLQPEVPAATLHDVAKNNLVKKMNSTDDLMLVNFLYGDGSSLSHLQTRYLFSCLMENIRAQIKKAFIRHKKNPEQLKKRQWELYQNLLEILKAPIFANLQMREDLFCQILQVGFTKKQRDYLKNDYLSMILRQELKNEVGTSTENNRKIEKNVEAERNRILGNWRLIVNEIQRLTPKELKEELNKTLDVAQQEIVRSGTPDILSNLMSSVAASIRESVKSRNKENEDILREIRAKIYQFLREAPAERPEEMRLDLMRKDLHFNRSFFTLFPDKPVSNNGEAFLTPVKIDWNTIVWKENPEALASISGDNLRDDLVDRIHSYAPFIVQNYPIKEETIDRQKEKPMSQSANPEYDYTPINSLYKIFKEKQLPFAERFALLEENFLKRGYPVFPSLLCSALRGYSPEKFNSMRDAVLEFFSKYNDSGLLILDPTTRAYLMNYYDNTDRERELEEILAAPFINNECRSVLCKVLVRSDKEEFLRQALAFIEYIKEIDGAEALRKDLEILRYYTEKFCSVLPYRASDEARNNLEKLKGQLQEILG